MKRSEMIQKMIDTSDEFKGELMYGDFMYRLFDALLDTCEENGMLAPARLEKHMINEVYYVNNWEPEE